MNLKGVDVVCKEGVSLSFYEEVRGWLDGKAGRRLFFIEDQPERLKELAREENAKVLLNDVRVKTFCLETPLQKEFIAKKIGWLSAFKELLVVDDAWKDLIERQHNAAHAIASDAAEFGVPVMRHMKANFEKPIRSLVKDSLKGVPAVICGAGPSLEKNGHLLKEWKGKAFLIAAGSAINAMEVAPDLAVALDPHIPLIRKKHLSTPLCLQSRMHPDSWRGITGEAFYIPDSHFAFDAWLTKAEPLDTGWTSGNAGVAVAEYLGCAPIVLIGMDYCYRGEKKYANQKSTLEAPLVQATDAQGRKVWTQRDWLLAIQWLEMKKGMNVSEGMEIKGWGPLKEFCGVVSDKWKGPLVQIERWKEWTESLKRCKENPDGEIVQELLLEPLWQIWAPLFERELMEDKHPIPMKEKLTIQKALFFSQVVEEHASVL